MTRKRLFIAATAAILVALAILGTILFRERVRRRAVFHPSAGEARPLPPDGVPPVERWSLTFEQANPEELDAMLDAIESKHPDLYAKWSLAYLHARALVELDQESEARTKLGPYLSKGHPFRDRALYHRADLADDAEASRFRRVVISEHADSAYRERAIDEELEFLAEEGDPKALIDFAAQVQPSASTERRREMSARIVETLVESEQLDDAGVDAAPPHETAPAPAC